VRHAVAASLAVVVGALAFDQAGFFPHSWVWASVLLLWLAAIALVLRAEVRVAAAELVWVGSLLGLTAWTLASAVWSDAPSQTLLEARRDLVYVGAAAAVVALGRAAAASLPAAVLVSIEIVLLAALGRYLTEPVSRRLVPQEGALLTWPLGYAKAVAALAALALPLGLAAAARAPRPWMRAAGAAGLAPALAAPVLAGSRGGEIAAGAGALALLLGDPRRAAIGRTAVALAAPGAAVVAACLASDLPSATLDAAGVRRGRLLVGAALLLGAAAMALIAPRVRVRDRRTGTRGGRKLLALATLLVMLAAIVAALPRLGGGGGALRALVGTERAAYWDVAWTEIAAHPSRGTGAGTYGRYWLVHGQPELGSALDAHNVYLETLAELGPFGLLLLLAALATPLVGLTRAVSSSRWGAAAAAAYVAFLVDAFVEWDWELPAVTAAAVLLGGALLLLGRAPARSVAVSGRARLAAVALAVALGATALAGAGGKRVPGAAAAPAAAAPASR
jgi:hypothetical protein